MAQRRSREVKEKNNYEIFGSVLSERDGQGIPNLRVEAWDKDLLIDGLLVITKGGHHAKYIESGYIQKHWGSKKETLGSLNRQISLPGTS